MDFKENNEEKGIDKNLYPSDNHDMLDELDSVSNPSIRSPLTKCIKRAIKRRLTIENEGTKHVNGMLEDATKIDEVQDETTVKDEDVTNENDEKLKTSVVLNDDEFQIVEMEPDYMDEKNALDVVNSEYLVEFPSDDKSGEEAETVDDFDDGYEIVEVHSVINDDNVDNDDVHLKSMVQEFIDDLTFKVVNGIPYESNEILKTSFVLGNTEYEIIELGPHYKDEYNAFHVVNDENLVEFPPDKKIEEEKVEIIQPPPNF